MTTTIRLRLLLLLAALALGLPAAAQLHRGTRTIIRGGKFEKPDSLRARYDSLRFAALSRQVDSLGAIDYAADSAAVARLRTATARLTRQLRDRMGGRRQK